MFNRKKRRDQNQGGRGTGSPVGDPEGSPYRIDGRPVGEAEAQAEWNRVALDLNMNARLTYTGDPALGIGEMVTDITDAGELVHDRITTEQLPVALFEPTRTQVVVDPETGEATFELHTKGALDLGMKLVPRGAAALMPLPGWRLGRGPGGLELDAPGSWPVARCAVDVPLDWVSAAVSHRYVLVLHGVQLGVRVPPKMRPEDYTAERRRAEITKARENGIVTGGLVRWEPAA